MQRYTDQELLALLDSLESDRVERKETFKDDVPKKALALAGFILNS